ncbi:MAG: DUF2752 domain-containing protein [Thermoguttaceae bacterium]|nr:DUF2752 domain-containing protein [Thermoguttaceae bacterium]
MDKENTVDDRLVQRPGPARAGRPVRRWVILCAGLVSALGLLAACAVFLRNDDGTLVLRLGEEKVPVLSLLPRCPFRSLTGLYCPGCGSTRSIHALLTGNWRASLAFHPLLLPILPLLPLLMARNYLARLKNGRRIVGFIDLLSKVIAAALLIFWVLRNIPLECFDWMRP